MDINKLREQAVPSAHGAAQNYFAIMTQDEGATPSAWFAAGAKVQAKDEQKIIAALADFVCDYPTAPEEALWRTAGDLTKKIDANAWEAQGLATQMAYACFRHMLLMGDDLITRVEARLRAEAVMSAGPPVPAAFFDKKEDQPFGIIDEVSGPREGYVMTRIENAAAPNKPAADAAQPSLVAADAAAPGDDILAQGGASAAGQAENPPGDGA